MEKKGGQRGRRNPRGVTTVPKQYRVFPELAQALESAAAQEGVSTSRYLNDLLAEHLPITESPEPDL